MCLLVKGTGPRTQTTIYYYYMLLDWFREQEQAILRPTNVVLATPLVCVRKKTQQPLEVHVKMKTTATSLGGIAY